MKKVIGEVKAFAEKILSPIAAMDRKKLILALLVTFSVVVLSNLSLLKADPFVYSNGNIVAVKLDEKGEGQAALKAIGRGSQGEPFEYQVQIKGSKGNDVKTSNKKKSRKSVDDLKNSPEYQKLKFRRQVDKALSEAVESPKKEGVYILPKSTSSGQRIRWEATKKGFDPLGLIFLPVILAYLAVGQREKNKKNSADRNRTFVSRLPNFINQLVLLMEGGMIFSDAYRKIAEAYSRKEDKDQFDQLIVQIQLDSDIYGCPIERQLLTAVRDDQFRPMARMGNVIWDSQQKGNDILGKLMDERLVLWEARKKQAEEEGRKTETRLAFPMAMILVALLIVSGGPAMLQIQGG